MWWRLSCLGDIDFRGSLFYTGESLEMVIIRSIRRRRAALSPVSVVLRQNYVGLLNPRDATYLGPASDRGFSG